MTDYAALVNRGTTDFKLKFAPGSPLLADEGDAVSMTGTVGVTTQLQWRVWLPPGTRCLQSTLFTNASPPESKALMRLGQPPVGNANDVTPENAAAIDRAAVLSLLQQGAEIPCYTPASAGSMKLSDGRMDSPIVITTGAWLYISALQVPGTPPQIFELTAYVKTDKAQYLAWYPAATWDAQMNPVAAPPETHAQRVIRRANETGLTDALMALSGTKTDLELAERAIATGTWAALLELVP